jgi:hypothetical protein
MLGGPLRYGVALGLGCLLTLPTFAQPGQVPAQMPPASPGITLDSIPPAYRDRCKSLLDKPTLRVLGPSETFMAKAPTYIWLLDNPEKAVLLWRMIGAQCTEVTRRPDGTFNWSDTNGSEVHWEAIVRAGTHRIWYAEGKVKPAMLMPTANVRALIVIHHQLEPGQDRSGRDRVQHRVDFYLQTDSHLLSLATRIMGHSAPRMAEQFCTQVQTFFGGLSWYLDEDPDRAAELFRKLNAGR